MIHGKAVEFTVESSENSLRILLAAAEPPQVSQSSDTPAVTPQPAVVDDAAKTETPDADDAAKTETPEELAAKPLDQKPVPPVFAVKNLPAKVKKDSVTPKQAELLNIKFDDSSEKGEMVLFQLNDFYPPSVTAIETERPGVLCEFLTMNVADSVQDTIYANGRFVERIRTEKQKNPSKVKVFLDLAPDHDYDLQQVFFKTDNLFVLIVNELVPDKKDAAN